METLRIQISLPPTNELSISSYEKKLCLPVSFICPKYLEAYIVTSTGESIMCYQILQSVVYGPHMVGELKVYPRPFPQL